jgi:hypothetical protein
MAASVIAAVLEKLDSFTYSTAPKFYFDEAPSTDSTGAQQRFPYGVIKDGGLQPEYQSDLGGIEVGSFTLEIYGTSLANVDAVVSVVKYNGQIPSSTAGLDFCTLAIAAPLYPVSLIRTNERRSFAGFSHQTERCHLCELTYSVVTEIRASG